MTHIRHILQSAFCAFLLSLPLLTFASAPADEDCCSSGYQLEATPCDIPSWEALGLEDLLTVPSETSWSAPQVAPAHWGSAHQRILFFAAAALPTPVGRHLRPRPLRSPVPNDYYLFFLYRLRL